MDRRETGDPRGRVTGHEHDAVFGRGEVPDVGNLCRQRQPRVIRCRLGVQRGLRDVQLSQQLVRLLPDQIAERHVTDPAELDPVLAALAGVTGYDGRMPDLRPEGFEAHADLDRAAIAAAGEVVEDAAAGAHSALQAAVETPVAEPGEEDYPGHQHDPADPEHPEDGGVRASERVDQQEAQGEQGNQDPYPRAATPHSQAVAPAISVDPVIRSARWGSGVARSAAAGGSAAGNSDPLAPLHLGELADLVPVFPCVLTRIDSLRPQVLSRGAEDLGEVGADPFLAILLPATALNAGITACQGRANTRISHVPTVRERPKSRYR
jgi:hypothetical protein